MVIILFIPFLAILPDLSYRFIQRLFFPTPAEVILTLKHDRTGRRSSFAGDCRKVTSAGNYFYLVI